MIKRTIVIKDNLKDIEKAYIEKMIQKIYLPIFNTKGRIARCDEDRWDDEVYDLASEFVPKSEKKLRDLIYLHHKKMPRDRFENDRELFIQYLYQKAVWGVDKTTECAKMAKRMKKS